MVTSGGIFNIRRQSLALAGPPISAKDRGVHLFGGALIQENTVSSIIRDTFTSSIPGSYQVGENIIIIILHMEAEFCIKIRSYLEGKQAKK